ncbi:MAG TPA: YceI family protein [Longimicrobiales bacterium]
MRLLKPTVISLAALTLSGSVYTPDPVRFDFDRSHSYIGFTVRHLAVTNVRGRFTDFSGHIMLNEEDITRSTVSVTIAANSVDTSHERRDSDLRGADFFDAERFPELRFSSTGIERTGDGLELVGDLTIRDVTKEVRIPFELVGPVTMQSGRKRLGAEGTLRINRFDYGLRWNRLQEAVPVVADEVRIDLSIEANTPRQGP